MFSTRIRSIREGKSLHQIDVAELAKVTLQTYQKWESGKTEPKATQIEMLAKGLGVPIEALFKDTDISVRDETKHKLIEAEKLSDEEKKCLNMFLEAMLIRHYSKTVSTTLGL